MFFFWPLLCLRVFNRLTAWNIFVGIVSESDKPALWATKTLLVVCVKTAFSDLGKHSPDDLVSSAARFRLYLIKREILTQSVLVLTDHVVFQKQSFQELRMVP